MAQRPAAVGRRDRMITIEQLHETSAPGSFPLESWTPLVMGLPAAKLEVSSVERTQGGITTAAFETRWHFEYREDCDPDLVDVMKHRRIVFGGRVLNVVGAEHLGRCAGIEFRTIGAARS
jgi:head-tail adaptor